MTSPESDPTSPQAQANSVLWTPTVQIISNVTTAAQAVVTTVKDNNYVTGMQVLINVPFVYGMTLNNISTKISVIDSKNFRTNINTTTLSPFVTPGITQFTPAQVSPQTGFFKNNTPGSPTGNPTGS